MTNGEYGSIEHRASSYIEFPERKSSFVKENGANYKTLDSEDYLRLAVRGRERLGGKGRGCKWEDRGSMASSTYTKKKI